MLNSLDIVIAFAVIMTVLSLLITILVQMVSSALALRGKNLANALALTFQTIDPKITEQAHSLAAQILRDPIFSDSIERPKSRSPIPFVNGATQALIAVERKLKEAERKLNEAEQEFAKTGDATNKTLWENEVAAAKTAIETERNKPGVLQRKVEPNREKPWGFWTWAKGAARHLGSAIRPGEIYRILHEFADLTETEAALRDIPPELVTTATRLIQCLGATDQPAVESQEKLRVINEVSKIFTEPAQRKAVVDSLANLGMTVERATTQAYDRFQRWFGSGQDRAEQWFQTHVRMVTIVMAIVTAFVLQLDTVDIYRRLRDQPKLVDALVKSAPGVLEQGGAVLDPANTSAYYTYLLWLQKHPLFPLKTLPASGDQAGYHQALADRLKEKPDAEYPLQQFDKALALARSTEGFSANTDAAAAKPAYTAWVKSFPTYRLDPEPNDTATKDSIRGSIQAKIRQDPAANAAPDQNTATTWVSEYDGMQTDGKIAFEEARKATFTDLKKKLDDAGFDLAPSSFLGRKTAAVGGWALPALCPLPGPSSWCSYNRRLADSRRSVLVQSAQEPDEFASRAGGAD